MLRRRSPIDTASHKTEASTFDRVTLNAFMLTATVAAAVAIGYGPEAALHHIADVLASARDLPMPDAAAWSGQMVF
jgi:hypothetical protein